MAKQSVKPVTYSNDEYFVLTTKSLKLLKPVSG